MERIGVEIHLNSIVTHIDADGVDVKERDGSVRYLSSKTKIWAAGVLASPLPKMLADATGAQCDRSGRIRVEPGCSLPGHPECSQSAI
jgi:NADH dehydrogenase